MRVFKAGLSLLFLLPAIAAAQVSGTVESIGFDSYVRPDCWTPMVITITPENTKSDTYEIHVRQQDLDRDLPIFTRTISVTGMSDAASRTQRFRMYFMPSPTDQGLPDARDPGSLRELQDRLKVSLHRSTGSKEWICDLPITGTLNNVDPVGQGPFDGHRGAKLIVAVSDGRSSPIYQDSTSTLLGVMEDVNWVTIQPRELPENVMGYDAVDAIVWLDADPAELKIGGDERFRAIESYVRRGGRLVICQPFDWQKILGFGDLLPVTMQGVEQKEDLMPLRRMAQPPNADLLTGPPQSGRDPLAVLAPPFRFARAQARPSAVVSEWITWKDANDISPYLVNMPLGSGAVTWVAQDLGDPSLTRTRGGWVYVWNHIFDWKNSPLPMTSQTPDSQRQPYELSQPMDLGKSLIERWMDLRSKSAWLITLAVLFFIGYWLIAGPGAYTYLATRKRTHLSWFVFGVCALGATGLTGLIVKLVLRGPPELKHFSVVRVTPDLRAVITSRIGLYIPRDGQQRIELKDTTQEAGSTITALPIHPAFLKDVPEQSGPEYIVPVLDDAFGMTPALNVPYRSTLKKFEATWIGSVTGAVQGSARLTEQNFIAGNLTNGTGQTLKNVYIAFNYPVPGSIGGDWLLFLPEWQSGITLDLTREFNQTADGKGKLDLGFDQTSAPTGGAKVRGRISETQDWVPFWYSMIGGNGLENTLDDTSRSFRQSLVMLSLFDRLPPMRDKPQQHRRMELLRRGGRGLDISGAIIAGNLVVLAEAEGPLPIPLDVEGVRVGGEGLNFYQFVLPLDRSALPSTTQPSAQ